jgi:hypothetical protein
MIQDDHSKILIERLRMKFVGEDGSSDEDLKILVGLCTHPVTDIRETALNLLLQPPVAEELAYYRRLVYFLMGSGIRIRQLPTPLLELLCEIITVSKKISEDPQMGLFFVRVLRNLPKVFLRTLCSKAFPLRSSLPHIPLRSFLLHSTPAVHPLKRRWRHLCRRLMHTPTPPPSWAQLTFADLGSLFKGKRPSQGPMVPSGRWLLTGRPLVQSVGHHLVPLISTQPVSLTSGITKAARIPLHRSTWRSAGAATLHYFDHLIDWQAEELRSVREVSRAVSQKTRRVVLSWHNATMAASGGWAFENLVDQFPLKQAWQVFQNKVLDRTRNMALAHDYDPATLAQLWELWKKRLVLPKLHHLLWENRMAATFDTSLQPLPKKYAEIAQSILHGNDMNERALLPAQRNFGWSGPVSPHQRSNFHEILGWANSRRSIWEEGLLRLVALMKEGQILLEEGSLPHLVLPWIDKFFISSRRKEDWEYLATLVQWLERQESKPLVLFWEDTPHSREPSLKLTLKQLHSQGYPYRGIGVFGWDGSSRNDAIEIISHAHHETVLFALRPCTDCHNFRPLEQLLENRDYRFFQDYDSSWKDGLCFLYAGTQVFPLLSVQSDREDFPAWFVVAEAKVPFGSYIRGRLREDVLGKNHTDNDPFSLRYALWANLC